MKKIKIIGITGAIVIIAVIAIITFGNRNNNQELTTSTLYEEKLDKAKELLSNEPKKADIVQELDNVGDNTIAITFDGSVYNIETLEAILKILDEKGARATFFIQGIDALEYPGIVNAIKGHNQAIGSYGLSGKAKMQDVKTDKLLEDFVRSMIVLSDLTSEEPTLLKLNQTEYTDSVLEAANASGFRSVVKTKQYLSYQSFSSYDMAVNFVMNLKAGSIISIKLSGVLSELEYATENKVKKNNDLAKEDKTPEERLIQVVSWLLDAINEKNINTVYLDSKEDSLFESDLQILNYNKSDLELLKKRNEGNLAGEVKKVEALELYTFYGIKNGESLKDVLDTLNKENLKATFFVTKDDLEKYPDNVNDIINNKQNIGIAVPDKYLEDFYGACAYLLDTEKYIYETYGITTRLIKQLFSGSTDVLREAVSALSLEFVNHGQSIVNTKDEHAKEVEEITSGIKPFTIEAIANGEIAYFRLDYYKESNKLVGNVLSYVNEKVNELRNPKKVIVIEQTTNKSNTTNNKDNDKNINGSVIEAIQKEFENAIDLLKENNKGKLSEDTVKIYTSEKAVAYTFFGISNEITFNDVINKLSKLKIKATFFVSKEDIEKYPKRVQKIVDKGHEIGIAVLPKNVTDFKTACKEILDTGKLLLDNYNVSTKLIRQPFGPIYDNMREATSALGYLSIYNTISMVKEGNENKTANEIINEILPEGENTIQRGSVIYFRMDYYEKNNYLVGQLVEKLKTNCIDKLVYKDSNKNNDSAYEIKGVNAIINNNDLTYNYPLKESETLNEIEGIIYKGNLDGMSEEDKFNYLSQRYIGNPDIVTTREFPGFTDEEVNAFDKTGKIANSDNTVFLTFDDWGTDNYINKLLYVLRKHNVKATFFVRTNYVNSNPNLLRAIAMEGHDIGSHTNSHMALSTLNKEKNIFESISNKNALKLQEELIISYDTLKNIIGDIRNDKGAPVLIPVFRSPTLAQSKIGLETVFDCGFKYSVSGDFSTGDYGVNSVNSLVNILKKGLYEGRGIESGSIIVMHMSPDAKFTPEALDKYLTDNKKFNFARLSDYLDLE